MAAIPESHRDLTEQPVASLSTIDPVRVNAADMTEG
jgi:hypothetical protein